jgi:hypothetical protein
MRCTTGAENGIRLTDKTEVIKKSPVFKTGDFL